MFPGWPDGLDPLSLVPEGSPSGENQEGKVWSWVPSRKGFDLRHPKVFFGPGALDTSTGNITLTGNQWNLLATSVPADGVGFRGGLAAYVPKGRYGLSGHVACSCPSNTTVEVKVTQGTSVSPDPGRPRLITETPIIVGGGVQTSPGPDWLVFSIPFSASDIQFAGARNEANEILVWLYPHVAGPAGAAMASSAQIPLGHLSKMTIIRWDGLHGTS